MVNERLNRREVCSVEEFLAYVFIQWNGKMMYLTTPSSKLKKVIQYINNSIGDEKEKLPQITLHGLRHTSATLLIAEKGSGSK